MCLILMHSENIEDQMTSLKSFQELEEWSKQEGINDMAKTAS
jgi:uncharacterized protein (DUF924 family)